MRMVTAAIQHDLPLLLGLLRHFEQIIAESKGQCCREEEGREDVMNVRVMLMVYVCMYVCMYVRMYACW